MELRGLFILMAVAVGCGDDGADPADAAVGTDGASGADGSTFDAGNDAAAQDCPQNFVPAPFGFADSEMTPPDGIYTVGFGSFAGTDFNAHFLLVLFDEANAPVGSDIDPPAPLGSAFVQILYDATVDSFEKAFVTSAGALQLSRACAAGVGGTLTGATFSEAVLSDGIAVGVVPGGCSFEVPSLSFDVGVACP